MGTRTRPRRQAGLQSLRALAALLERLEGLPRQASAAQYLRVARQVVALLQQAEPGDDLDALLAAAPATAELYENLRYAQAGLCRTPLDDALQAELAATALIGRARAAR